MPTNALDYITIKGFKSITSIEIELRPINVVIGPNGSGKSNFIGVFEFLHGVRAGRLKDYVKVAGGADKVLHFGSKTTKEISFALSFAEGPYELKLHPTAADELYEYEETTLLEGNPDRLVTNRLVTTDEDNAKWDEERRSRLDRLFDWRVYHFEDTSFSSPMRKTARVDDNRFLRADGANLPAFLYLLHGAPSVCHDSSDLVHPVASLLLDHVQPEDVLVADRVDGGTQLTRLESEPLAKWLEDYSLGQLWEKNEIGGRPVPG